MAGGLHHHHEIGGAVPFPPPIRSAERAASYAAPDREQAAGVETPLSAAPAACSLFPSFPLCGTCAGTPARRCCLTLAAQMMAAEHHFVFIQRPRHMGKTFAARMAAQAEGSKYQNLTAPMGGAA